MRADATLGQLAAGHYLDACDPVVLRGESATATYLSVLGLTARATRLPHSLRHHRPARHRTRRGRRRTEVSRVFDRYARLDVLLLDELGCVPVDPHWAELLFRISTGREDRTACAVATNLPFSERTPSSPTRLIATLADRVTSKKLIYSRPARRPHHLRTSTSSRQ